MNWTNRALLLANVWLGGMLIYLVATQRLVPGSGGIEYKDLVVIVLTALAVILAGVTIFVAALAIWGYTAIRESAEKAAAAKAEEAAKVVAADVARATATRETPEAVRLYLTTAGVQTPNVADVEGLAASLKEGDANGVRDGDRAKPKRNYRRKNENPSS